MKTSLQFAPNQPAVKRVIQFLLYIMQNCHLWRPTTTMMMMMMMTVILRRQNSMTTWVDNVCCVCDGRRWRNWRRWPTATRCLRSRSTGRMRWRRHWERSNKSTMTSSMRWSSELETFYNLKVANICHYTAANAYTQHHSICSVQVF